MRTIEGTLSEMLSSAIGSMTIDKASAYRVKTYSDLMSHVANLAYLNKDYLIFFRGQGKDYKSKSEGSTFYPTIYRGDYLPQREINYRFEILNQASRLLTDTFSDKNIQGYKEIRRKKFIQWSILQHYGVCNTPLLDFTHSIHVACSFAQLQSDNDSAYVYLFGLPYFTNRISINSEHDLVNIRLLSICPPDAMRPYYQEGYLAGTDDITTDYESKTELDFKNRLIAKFEIPSGTKFWDRGFSSIPKTVLYPPGDKIGNLCKSLKVTLKNDLQPGEMGEFLKIWTEVEEQLVEQAKSITARVFSVREAINMLAKSEFIPKELMFETDVIRRFRNQLVHKPKTIEPVEVQSFISRIRNIQIQLKNLIRAF